MASPKFRRKVKMTPEERDRKVDWAEDKKEEITFTLQPGKSKSFLISLEDLSEEDKKKLKSFDGLEIELKPAPTLFERLIFILLICLLCFSVYQLIKSFLI